MRFAPLALRARQTLPPHGAAGATGSKTGGDNLRPEYEERRNTQFMATAAMPTRDDFAKLLNETLGGENEGFEGKVVKGTVTAIENDLVVIDVGLKSEGRV